MKTLLMICITLCYTAVTTFAQTEVEHVSQVNQTLESEDIIDETDISPKSEYFDNITRHITKDRIIPPYKLEVTFNKTVHIIFPSAVTYIDLGSPNLIAGKATGSENVVRVKASTPDFKEETNFSVITEQGNFFSFNVSYSKAPNKLNVEMKDFIHDGSLVNRPNNAMEIYLSELGQESPKMVRLIMKTVYKNNKRKIKHIGSKQFSIQYQLKSIYVHNNLLYLHTEIANRSNVPYDIDFISFKIVDKELSKRTAIQETIIHPVRAHNLLTTIKGQDRVRTLFAFERFTIPDDKQLIVELFEKSGGRNQKFIIENSDITRAEIIDDLKLKL